MADEFNFAPDQTVPAQTSNQQSAPQAQNDRTADQFDKLIESNRTLHQQLQTLEQRLKTPQPAPQAPAPADPDSFVTIGPDGERYVDEQKMQSTIKQLKAEAEEAKRIAQRAADQQQNTEQSRQEREAFQAYPELDYKNPDKLNKAFHNQVRAAIFDSLMNPQDYGGNALTFKEAADYVRTQSPQQPAPVMEVPVTETAEPAEDASALEEAQQLKQQSSTSVASQPNARSDVQESVDIELLRSRTRYGDDSALALRLANVDHTGQQPVRDET